MTPDLRGKDSRPRLTPHYSNSIACVAVILLTVLAPNSSALCGAIHDAAYADNYAKIQSLLKGNPELVFSKDRYGNTPLYDAVVKRHKDVVELLLANKADVDARSPYGYTPLDWAAFEGDGPLALLLVEHGAKVNARDEGGDTPLHMAAMGGHKDVVKLLLAHGADANATDSRGDTPLHKVAYNGDNKRNLPGAEPRDYKGVVEVLLANSANINARNHDGDTPLFDAELMRQKDTAELFRERGGQYLSDPPPTWEMDQAVKDRDTAKVTALLKGDPTLVSSKDHNNDTPLHIAAMWGYPDMVKLLIAKGCDVNAKNNDGNTALHIAEQSGYNQVVKLLREHGGHE